MLFNDLNDKVIFFPDEIVFKFLIKIIQISASV